MINMTSCQTVRANEEYMLLDATALYKFYDVFRGGILLYRDEHTQELKIFDLNKSTMTFIKHGPPRNCLEMLISSNDGVIFGTCVRNTLIEVETESIKTDE